MKVSASQVRGCLLPNAGQRLIINCLFYRHRNVSLVDKIEQKIVISYIFGVYNWL